MAMDDVYKAMGMFQDGMQQLAISNGINSATQQVNEINATQMDEMEKRNQQEQVARQLAAQLIGAGANGQQVQMASQALAPTPIANGQDMYAQGVLKNNQGMQQQGQAWMKVENQPKVDLENVKGEWDIKKANATGAWGAKAAESSAELKINKEWNQLAKSFNTEIRGDMDKLQSMSIAGDLITLGNVTDEKGRVNSVAQNASRAFITRMTEKGPLSEFDVTQYGGSKDLFNKIQRMVKTGWDGDQWTARDAQELQQVMVTYKNSAEGKIKNTVRRLAGQAASGGWSPSEDAAVQRLIGGDKSLQSLMGVGQQQQPGQQQQQPGQQPGQPPLPAGVPPGSEQGTFMIGGKARRGFKGPDGKLYLIKPTNNPGASGSF